MKGSVLERAFSDIEVGRLAFGSFELAPRKRLLTRNGAPVEIGGRALFEYQLRDESPRSGWRKLIRLITRRPPTLTAVVTDLTWRRPPG